MVLLEQPFGLEPEGCSEVARYPDGRTRCDRRHPHPTASEAEQAVARLAAELGLSEVERRSYLGLILAAKAGGAAS